MVLSLKLRMNLLLIPIKINPKWYLTNRKSLYWTYYKLKNSCKKPTRQIHRSLWNGMMSNYYLVYISIFALNYILLNEEQLLFKSTSTWSILSLTYSTVCTSNLKSYLQLVYYLHALLQWGIASLLIKCEMMLLLHIGKMKNGECKIYFGPTRKCALKRRWNLLH